MSQLQDHAKFTGAQLDEPKLDHHHSKKIKLNQLEPTSSSIKLKAKPHLYANKIILAPMVRANSLPFRLLCLRNGAQLVYSEELIDHRVVTCKRVENRRLGSVDFVDKDGRVIFRTCAEERAKVVLQLGSNDPERALKAAKLVCNDVLGIDFNFGCPKKFSIAGGMGAALLTQPHKIQSLLTHCVTNLDIPVTCKIRILPTLDDTLKLVKLIESCGVSAIAVHGRTKEQRPADDNNIQVLRSIAETLTIPLIANGESNNIKTYSDIIDFRDKTKASSVMLARVAMKNPAVFRNDTVDQTDNIDDDDDDDDNSKHFGLGKDLSSHDNEINYTKVQKVADTKNLVEQYLRLAALYDNHPSNVKYSLQSLMSNGCYGKDFVAKLHSANKLESICRLFGLGELFETSNQNINSQLD